VTTDAAGYVYLAGVTSDSDFPVSPGAYQTRGPTESFSDYSFIARLSADLGSILFSTYFGDDNPLCVTSACEFRRGQTIANAIAVDDAGAVTVAGVTDSDILGGPVYEQLSANQLYPFIVRFSADGGSLQASSNFGLPLYSSNGIAALALDGSGNTIVVGDAGVPLAAKPRAWWPS